MLIFNFIRLSLRFMSSRGYSHRGRRGGTGKRTRGNGETRGARDGGHDGPNRAKPTPIARSPERQPKPAVVERNVDKFMDWPADSTALPQDEPLTDPQMPSDLVGVIGYCSEKSIGEVPGTMISPSDVLKGVQEGRKYLFGSDLATAMRNSLEEYTKVFYIYL